MQKKKIAKVVLTKGVKLQMVCFKTTATIILSAQSQPFFQGYRSILPTSLAYFIPQTNGFEP